MRENGVKRKLIINYLFILFNDIHEFFKLPIDELRNVLNRSQLI